MTEATHPLKAFLQLQLASDSSAVLNVPHVLKALTSDSLLSSAHSQKWTARVNSLIHSQDLGARWAGLCLAYRTAVLSKSLMLECAQSWIGAALPILSKNEPLPNLKAAIRLLRYIFSGATDTPEFQRQLVTPNVPKYSQAVIALAEKHDDPDLKLLALNTLTMIVPLHPTLHKVLHASLSTLALHHLNGSAPTPISSDLVKASSRLYAVLHFTGGKVGAVGQWRKSLDNTLAFTWEAFHALRSTFPSGGRSGHTKTVANDALGNVALNIDRLRCGITVLRELMKSTTPRPVQVPINSILQLTVTMLSCTQLEQTSGPVDQSLRAVEASAIPTIWSLGCHLLVSFAKCTRCHLTPHVPRLLLIIAYQLEQPQTPSSRLSFLLTIPALLSHTCPLHDGIVLNRTVRAILPSLAHILLERSAAEADGGANKKSRKGKKRARGYEGDELFQVAREVICPGVVDGEVVLATLDASQVLLRNPHLFSAVQSISGRILLSMLLSLPQIPKNLLSPDSTLHGKVLSKVQDLCIELGMGTTSSMSKSLGLVVRRLTVDGSDAVLNSLEHNQRVVDMMIHPRLPPLLRPLPHVEVLALFRDEEGEEETRLRESMHLVSGDVAPAPTTGSKASEQAPHQPFSNPVPDPMLPKTSFVSGSITNDVEMQPPQPINAPLQSTTSGTDSALQSQHSLASHAPPTVPVLALPAIEATGASLRPPPESLAASTAGLSDIPIQLPVPQPEPIRIRVRVDEDEDENEEMPSINMDSDSEAE
ncbi:hypothetical protein NEOLEDRAFT_1127941 [Neolentinus lepideus HHB14362 ss-1]|uniref:Pre-rRNA-processing protein RIX1 n=1 Tax=Neolentinus lepideus HHB14362 ss-1 TaxID=1314782 RepID=A0A165V799_9AGAM|nr:hypothetical protein NEOLEDRAFT_1127941 [Neolentinus lepideus HHB14362 ss-1]